MRLASRGRPAAAVVCAASLVLGAAGCSSDDAEATPANEPGASDSASPASADPTPVDPADGQSPGRYGVTYAIQDWDEHRDDVLVVGYKLALESFAGSVNTHQVTEGLQARFTKPLQRTLLGRVQFAWRTDLHVDPVARVRVLDSERRGASGSLTVCHWVDSADFKTADNELYGDPETGWEKVDIGLVQRQDTWRVATIDSVGRCPGGAPR